MWLSRDDGISVSTESISVGATMHDDGDDGAGGDPMPSSIALPRLVKTRCGSRQRAPMRFVPQLSVPYGHLYVLAVITGGLVCVLESPTQTLTESMVQGHDATVPCLSARPPGGPHPNPKKSPPCPAALHCTEHLLLSIIYWFHTDM